MPDDHPRGFEVAAAVVAEPPSRTHTLARALTLLGILTLTFSLFQWKASGISETRAQRELHGAFTELLGAGTGLGYDTDGKPIGIPAGTPVALIKLPTIDVSKIIVEGTSSDDLKRGPGHVATSSLPGQAGHAIVAGRRSTFGAPFAEIEKLRSGDSIEVITPYGTFAYRVRETQTVTSGEAAELAAAKGSLLTLLTSDSGFSATKALAVVATLDGEPSTFSDPPRPAVEREGAVPVGGNSGALPAAILSGVLLAATVAMTGEMYRRWRRLPTHLLTTPVILALLFLWMQSVASLLPATL